MVAAGVFHPEERLELIEGEILPMTPQGSGHATAVSLVGEVLRKAFGPGFTIRVQMPLALVPDSEPEPDVAVVLGGPRDYKEEHPRTAVLVVEVADATLDYDRGRKTTVYARAGIQEFWILNLPDRCLEIHRDPTPGGTTQSGYQTTRILASSDSVSLLAKPEAIIAVSELLP